MDKRDWLTCARGVLLHKLILLELVMGYWQGTQQRVYCRPPLLNADHIVQASSFSSTNRSMDGGCLLQPSS